MAKSSSKTVKVRIGSGNGAAERKAAAPRRALA
jgi:hypothetical protein